MRQRSFPGFGPEEQLVRVTAPHFVAGLVTSGGRVIEAAPILRWTIGRDVREVRDYFVKRNWHFSPMSPVSTAKIAVTNYLPRLFGTAEKGAGSV